MKNDENENCMKNDEEAWLLKIRGVEIFYQEDSMENNEGLFKTHMLEFQFK